MNKIYILLIALTIIGVPCSALASDTSVQCLLHKARAEYLLGRPSGALKFLEEALVCEPGCKEAKALLCKIKEEEADAFSHFSHDYTKAEMLEEVDLAWKKPEFYFEKQAKERNSLVESKLDTIIIPEVRFNNIHLSEALLALTEIVLQVDESHPVDQRGVNFALIDPNHLDPKVSVKLRNVKLGQLINLLSRSVNFVYDFEDNVIVVRDPNFSTGDLSTEFFPITRTSIVKMTGNKFLEEYEGDEHIPAILNSQLEEETALLAFFERAGVPFCIENGGPDGATIAFDGTQLIVTQSKKNLQRVKNILRRYDERKQVEIEAKFIEVQEGALEELGFKWNITSGNPSRFYQTAGNLRTLNDAFNPIRESGTNEILSRKAPVLPQAINLGSGASPIASVLGVVDMWNINVIIKALEQHTGSDLMSAPKLTVLSGKTARITVAKRFKYPESFGDVQSAVGSSGAHPDSSSAGVTITAGTPRHFVEENVGVEMKVTPTVEMDNKHINLRLDPRVTEFEGFVEYGGDSIALTGQKEVRVASGFIQPIFSTREINTELTIADGATVVMGGLTREEVRQVNDKVPVLGSIPLLGRLFRSKGETYQKKNLLIFVTANLVSPGGNIQRKNGIPLNADGIFRNPVQVTPGGRHKLDCQ